MPLPVDERAHHTKFEQDKTDVCTQSHWATHHKSLARQGNDEEAHA